MARAWVEPSAFSLALLSAFSYVSVRVPTDLLLVVCIFNYKEKDEKRAVLYLRA